MAARSQDKQDAGRRTAQERLRADKEAAWGGFLKAHALVTQALDSELAAKFGIPLSAFDALRAVARSDEGYLRMSELAERARLSPSRISRLVRELEGRGLLERRACPSDTRVVYAAITAMGRDLVAKLERLHREVVERRFFSRLSDDQVAELASLWPRVLATSGAPEG